MSCIEIRFVSSLKTYEVITENCLSYLSDLQAEMLGVIERHSFEKWVGLEIS